VAKKAGVIGRAHTLFLFFPGSVIAPAPCLHVSRPDRQVKDSTRPVKRRLPTTVGFPLSEAGFVMTGIAAASSSTIRTRLVAPCTYMYVTLMATEYRLPCSVNRNTSRFSLVSPLRRTDCSTCALCAGPWYVPALASLNDIPSTQQNPQVPHAHTKRQPAAWRGARPNRNPTETIRPHRRRSDQPCRREYSKQSR
jgi:hypothetical protein